MSDSSGDDDLLTGEHRSGNEKKQRSSKKKRRSVSKKTSNNGENIEPENVEKSENEDDKKMQAMRSRIKSRERQVAENEPELHIIGEIDGGVDFGKGVCCRWKIDHGAMWEHLGGFLEGQTQVDYPLDGDNAVWSHPIDLHFVSKGLQGWPRILMQVWKMDENGRLSLQGYGFTHIPNCAGYFELDVATWRPVGTLKEEIAAKFLGTTPQLRDIDVLFKKAWGDRCRLSTVSSGTIRLNLDVVLRNFADHNVDLL